MTSSAQLLGALQELANVKQIDRHELLDLLRDGIHAALAKRYGVTVRDEISIDDMKGTITVTVLKSVVEEVEDPLMKKIRLLDKLIDELAKGKSMEKILRQ